MNEPAIVSSFRRGDSAGVVLRAASPERVHALIEEFSATMRGCALKSEIERSAV